MARGSRLFWALGAATVCLAMLLAASVTRAAAPTLYVSSAADYKIALAVAGEERSVLELAGTARCHFNEPREDGGTEPFSVFPEPVPMRREVRPRGFFVGRSGFPSANVWANFHRNRATGTYSYEESEESFHCEVHHAPFEAHRYEPIDDPTATRPKSGESRVYYDGQGPTHLFLRTAGKFLEGVRGEVRSTCPVGSEGVPERPLPLFGAPASIKHDAKGRFHVRAHSAGRLRGGGTYAEVVKFSGRLTEDAVTGTYLRVHTAKRRGSPPERCVTGPVAFAATRYLSTR